MELKIFRKSDNGESTLGLLYLNDEFFGYTLEDTYRETKVKHKTRIPAGKYPITLREVVSPLTEKYRKQYEWFSYHLELQNVPDFQNIYIHIGNYETDTSGCILVGYGQQIYPERMITHSTPCYKELYSKVIEAAKNNELTIQIMEFS